MSGKCGSPFVDAFGSRTSLLTVRDSPRQFANIREFASSGEDGLFGDRKVCFRRIAWPDFAARLLLFL